MLVHRPSISFSTTTTALTFCLSVSLSLSLALCIILSLSLTDTLLIAGVLAWIANNVTYDNFWSVYLDLKNLHKGTSVFVNIIKGYFRDAGDNFVEHTTEICRSQDKNTITSVVELLSKINDIRVLSVMENIVDTATENNETLVVVPSISSTNANNYLPTVVSSTVNYIENYLQTNYCDESIKTCMQTLQKASCVFTNMETLRKINKILFDISIQTMTSILASDRNFAVHSIFDLDWKKVNYLTSSRTSYIEIKYFTENARSRTRIHPCVVMEIVLKWWSKRTDSRGEFDMSFIIPLITTIHTVCSDWYDRVCRDKRYRDLMAKLDIPKPTTPRYMYYDFYGESYKCNLAEFILVGDGKPACLHMRLQCSDDVNWRAYKNSMPKFRCIYEDNVFPPYGFTEHHWYMSAYGTVKFLSFITDYQDEIISSISVDSDIDNDTDSDTDSYDEYNDFQLHFVPNPGTFW